jgi:hypothetical protein
VKHVQVLDHTGKIPVGAGLDLITPTFTSPL